MDKKTLEIDLKLLFGKWSNNNNNVIGSNIEYHENEDGVLEYNDDAHIFIDLKNFGFDLPILREYTINRICFDYEKFIFILENNDKIKYDDLEENEYFILSEYLKILK